jgi:hypothetical protein
MSLKRITFIFSIIAVIYFPLMYSLSVAGANRFVLFGVINEMCTIPIVLGIIVFFLIALTNVIKQRFNTSSKYLYSFLLLLALISFGVWWELTEKFSK